MSTGDSPSDNDKLEQLRKDPDYRAAMRELYEWLADGKQLHELQKLVEDIKKSPHRRRSSSRHVVREPSGKPARRSQRSRPERAIHVVGIPRNPLFKVITYMRAAGALGDESPEARQAAIESVALMKAEERRNKVEQRREGRSSRQRRR